MLELLVSGILVIALLAASMLASPALTILAIAIAAANIFILRKLVYKNQVVGRDLLDGNERLLSHTKDLFSNFRRIRSSGRQQLVAKKSTLLAKDLSKLIGTAGRNQAELRALSTLLGGVSLALVCYFATSIFQLPWTAAATCLLLITRVLTRCNAAQQGFQFLTELVPAWERTVEFRNQIAENREPEFIDSKTGKKPFSLIEFKKVSYENSEFQRKSVGPFSLELRPSEIVLITGSTGVGKSTFCDVASGILDKSSGQIFIDGQEVSNAHTLRNYMAYIPQDSSLISGSIRHNLEFFGPEIPSEDMEKALEIVNLSERIKNLDYLPGEFGSKLSGGERQRLLIAQALLTNRSALIIDESTSGLDEPLEIELLERIRKEYPELTIVLVSHRSHLEGAVDRTLSFQ